jgi:hypothetical protein
MDGQAAGERSGGGTASRGMALFRHCFRRFKQTHRPVTACVEHLSADHRDRRDDEGSSKQWGPSRVFQVLEQASSEQEGFLQDLTEGDLTELATTYQRFEDHDKSIIDVGSYLEQLDQLRHLPFKSPMRFLGAFALLESLLTHAPNQTDPYDSITRQVKKKLALLDHRWEPSLSYEPFGQSSAETVWGKMYAYRSNLAHGTHPPFASNLAGVLVSHEAAMRLLQHTVKTALRHVLVEPLLMADLRDC